MRLIERVHKALEQQSQKGTSVNELLPLLEQIVTLADPTEQEDDLLLEWFFNIRGHQIRQLQSDGLNALAKAEQQKLKSLTRLRNYHSFNGAILRPGDRFYCDDHDHHSYDFGGEILAYDRDAQTYTVRFDGPSSSHRNPSEQLSADQIWPDSDVQSEQAKYAEKWTKGPIIRLLDLSPLARKALENRLSIFLCHASEDKSRIKDIYTNLKLDGFHPWLDVESLVPGDDWETRIQRDIHSSDVALICLSNLSISKQGFFQSEIEFAVEAAKGRSEEQRYLIPLLLEPCAIPDRLAAWHAVNLFERDGYKKLVSALRDSARALGRLTD